MKLRIHRQELNDALKTICAVAAGRTPKPILRCVRLDVGGDVVFLAATDLELSVRCAITQVEVEETGHVVVQADTLSRIVSECPDDSLDLAGSGSMFNLRGEDSHFQMVTQDAAEFPPVPEMADTPDFHVDHAVLRRLMEWTAFAAARESTRYAINGVLWEIREDQLTLVATDGRRLSLARTKLASAPHLDHVQPSEVIVPGKALSLFMRLPLDHSGPVGVKMMTNQLTLTWGGGVLSTALVEGHFPKYQDVIPGDCDKCMEVEAVGCLSALKRAALLASEESKGIRMSLDDGTLTLSSRAPEQGAATVRVPVRYSGTPLEIGFNPAFLLDVFRVTQGDVVSMAFKEPNRPGLIRDGDDFLYVVMPVNLASA